MSKQPTERTLFGRSAAGGQAVGRIHLCRRQGASGQNVPRIGLAEAIGTALAELRALQVRADPIGAQFLQFQIELLEDPALTFDAFAAIETGADPSAAFVAAIDTHLRVYEEAGSEYVRARASDVHDLRDRVLRALREERAATESELQQNSILVADSLTPSAFLEIDWGRAAGAATFQGSPASHVAMLARSRGIPMIVGLAGVADDIHGLDCVLDADAGCLLLEPSAATLAQYEIRTEATAVHARKLRETAPLCAVTRSGRRIGVYLNVDRLETLADIPAAWFDGIGLTRTELLFATTGLPSEEGQIAVYSRLFDWAAGRPTTIRLLDAGGDKPVSGVSLQGESNPFLGVRGVRLLLRGTDLLATQLRAIVIAAAGRPARILIPMVTVERELDACRAVYDTVLGELAADRSTVQLGMMVETPAAALAIERFGADFFSIGTNDLTQYVMAASRECTELAYLHPPMCAPVLELIRRVVGHAASTGREVSVCGDAAFDPGALSVLLAAGVNALSIPAHAVPAVKSAIRSWGPDQ